MVNLLEYEGKALFSRYRIPIPNGYVIGSPRDLRHFSGEMVVKAQVRTGGRGKLGGIVKIKTEGELTKAIEKIKTINFGGEKAKLFLVEEAIQHKKEFYVSITLDRSLRTPILIVSKTGGVNIEDVSHRSIERYRINPLIGVPQYIKEEAAEFLGIDDGYKQRLFDIIGGLWSIYDSEDAELVEINPLALTENGFTALDSKVVIEDDAVFRHPEFKRDEIGDELELEARSKGMSFVRMGGDIGIIANGAGLTMATLDMIKTSGGRPGDFLDLGGTDDPKKVADAINIVSKIAPKVLLVNIFGGVTKCDSVAIGIISAFEGNKTQYPAVIRLRGANEVEGRKLLKKNGMEAFLDLDEAVKRAVSFAKEG